MATIEVLVTGQAGSSNRHVAAEPNPADANRGELVIWNIRPSSETFRVVFKGFQPNDEGLTQHISDQCPFSQPLSIEAGLVGGIIDSGTQAGRYIYDIVDERGHKLNWLNLLSPGENFGGLDVPRKPPGTPPGE
jgi:hypothetical protein